jgi:hypothetical protein
MLSQIQERGEVLAIWREPFALGSPHVEAWRPGLNICEIIDKMSCLPVDFKQRGEVHINGQFIPREMWASVRPKATSVKKPIGVTFHLPLQGGDDGGGGSKSIFALIAALALTIVTAGISGGILAPYLGASFAAGKLGAIMLAAGVSLVGGLLINGFVSTPVKSARNEEQGGATLGTASLNGNVLEPNAAIPRVIGTRRIFPPFLFEPITEYIGQDEYVFGVLGLAGPHKIEDIRIGESVATIDENDADIQIETSEGLADSEKLQILNRYGRTFSINTEMTVHGTKPDDLSVFVPPLPVFHATSTADDPDETWLHLFLVGLILQEENTKNLRIPFRIRMRLRGDTEWRYLPELHFMDRTQSQRRMQIKFIFGSEYSLTLPEPPITRGFIEARKSVPAQNVDPIGVVWNADSYFSAGSGNDNYILGTATTTKVKNVVLETDTAYFYLSEASWPRGIYDIEIKRGSAFKDEDYETATYEYENNIIDFFGLQNGGLLPLSRAGLLDRVNIVRTVNIKSLPPVNQKNLALISVQARNRSVNNISVKASGYVNDYDEATEKWDDLKITSNPAPHYRDILSGILNLDPLPDEMRDEQSLIDWRDVCEAQGLTCDMIAEGTGLSELLRIVASCGYARPYQSEVWGVVRDYDRSAEGPIQVFSSRNINNFSWRKAFPRLPAGLRINFRDERYEYSGKQSVVYRNGASENDQRIEQVTYEGLTSLEKCIERAKRDLKQGQYRSVLYSFTTGVAAINCRMGSLVAVNHDIIQKRYGSARIASVNLSGASVIGITLDETFEIKNYTDWLAKTNILDETNVLDIGVTTSVGIQKTDGSFITVKLSNINSDTSELTFEIPITTDVSLIETGCHVLIGTSGIEYRRLIVTDIQPGNNLIATLTLVDEAPEIWEN